MYKYTLFALLAVAQARFGQEQVPIPAIAALKEGAPGVAQTIAGAAVSDLLAGANACAKLQRGDQIIQELGTSADVVAAAIGMVAAEKNFNPFAQSIPTICSDPTLPATEALRGITPLIDPAVGGSDVANALSGQTVKAPLAATGMSVADLLAANGFTNFTTQDLAGNTGAAPAAGSGAVGASSSIAVVASSSIAVFSSDKATTSVASAVAVATDQCGAQVAAALSSASAAAGLAASTTTVAASNDTAAAPTAAVTSTAASTGGKTTIAGADFGSCNPTMKFEGGLDNRPANEFTFQSQDPAIIAIQEEALNPNIITNRICDSLTNFCGANDVAKTTCASAQAQILALGTRDITTAQTWNTLVGFEGVSTNPDGGASVPTATATAAAGKHRRWRA